jgi:hypothetical protein
MRRGGSGKRRDSTEAAIIHALRAIGLDVWQVSGHGLPDLIVRKRHWPKGHSVNLEVKSEKGQRTQAQKESEWPIVRDVQSALDLLGVKG